jgi:hypothetical protein
MGGGVDSLKTVAALFVLALVVAYVPAAAGSVQTAKIVVQVKDQTGAQYDGVQVTIYSQTGSNTSTGVTVNGVYVSVPLQTFETYTVLVTTNSQTLNRSVILNGTDTFVRFSMTRPAPVAPERPKLVVTSLQYVPSLITPGSDFAVALTVNNTGVVTAYAGTVTLTPGVGISLVGSIGTSALPRLFANQSTSVNFQMSAATTIPSGYIPVGVQFAYSDSNGVNYNDTSSFNIQVVSRPDVRVGTFGLSVAPLRPGISSVLSLTLLNAGGDRAYGVSVTLDAPAFLPGTATNYLGSVAAGGVASASFYLNVNNQTAPGNYKLALNINYSDVVGLRYNKSSVYSIDVSAFVPPAVTVTNVLLDPPVLTTGSTGTLTLFLANNGQSEADNVRVAIVNGSGILASNFFGLGTMVPGAQVTQVVGLNVNPGLQPQGRTLGILVSYSDINGRTYTSSVAYQTEVYLAPNIFSLTNIVAVVGLVILVVALLILERRYSYLDPIRRLIAPA